ncbi:MAG: hypothetical protein L0Y71_05300 [Gemmataceae bacterium]|nr:hypothetical protein [Gemmataceae bacterium]
MSEARKDEQDRWRELHELLGLPPQGPPPAAASRSAAATVKETTPVPARAPERETPDEDERVWDEPVYEEPDADEPVRHGSKAAEAPTESPELAIVNDEALAPPLDDEDIPPPLDDDELGPPAERDVGEREAGDRDLVERDVERDDDDRTRRGRRRGRRGRRSRSRRDEARAPQALRTEDAEGAPTDEAAVEASGPPGAEDAPRRVARGSRRRGERDFADEDMDSDDEAARSPTSAVDEEDDDEPIETFADWNVPSWPEIVASLYRPER